MIGAGYILLLHYGVGSGIPDARRILLKMLLFIGFRK